MSKVFACDFSLHADAVPEDKSGLGALLATARLILKNA